MITKFKIYESKQLELYKEYDGKFVIIDNGYTSLNHKLDEFVYYLYNVEEDNDSSGNFMSTVLCFPLTHNFINYTQCDTLIIDKKDIYNYDYYSIEQFFEKFEDYSVKIYKELIKKENDIMCQHVRKELIEKLEQFEPIKVIKNANKYNL